MGADFRKFRVKKWLNLCSFWQGAFLGPGEQLLHLIYLISPFFYFLLSFPRLVAPLLAGIIPLFFWDGLRLGGGAREKLGEQKKLERGTWDSN